MEILGFCATVFLMHFVDNLSRTVQCSPLYNITYNNKNDIKLFFF